MARQYRSLGLVLLVALTLVVVAVGPAVANDLSRFFMDEFESLVTLKVLPENLNPVNPVTKQDYLIYGQKLLNGRSERPLVIISPSELLNPDDNIKLRDALVDAGLLLGYRYMESLEKMREITPRLAKDLDEEVNGYEMAYIFHQLLYTRRINQQQTVLEERYLLGGNSRKISRIMAINGNQFVLEDEGTVERATDFQAFHIQNNRIIPLGVSGLYVGQSGVKFFYNQQGQVQTAVVEGTYFPETIRVLLSQDLSSIGGSNSYDFPEVQIKADQPFKITVRANGRDRTLLVVEEQKTMTFKNQNGKVEISIGNWKQVVDERVYLKSYYPHNIQFTVLSTKRHGKNPAYEGILEIIPSEKDGHLYLINDLHIEDYLKKVVPSEIPTSWGQEAFKVQAVAARSYAISQIFAGRHQNISANVDDSTSSQVYNNAAEHPGVNQAILETRGIVPLYNGKVIDAVFSSTSAGYTAGNEDVWHSTRTLEFPGTPIPYLRPKSQIIDAEVPDLTIEENALAFFKDQTLKSFDAISPFYRWRLELTREELEKTISHNLPARKNADVVLGTDFIQTLTGKPVLPNDNSFSIGTLKDLKVVGRGEGGNMLALDVVGTNGTYRIWKEYNIRFVIRPMSSMTGSSKDVIIQRFDGSNLRNYSILPSAFAAFEIERDAKGEIVKVVFYGGGNGHGVGLSQWGMKGMADAGYSYDEILKNYYTDIELRKIY